MSAFLLVLMLAACASATAGGEVTISTCDGTARLRKGDTLVVRLPSQVTTGYLWSLASQSAGLVKAQGEPQTERRPDDLDGGGETQVFRFAAPAAGRDVLTFHNRRPVEKDKPPLKTCAITVEVGE